ncbi:MAG TPA: DUF6249 domain-containing protein [Opitutaceae bacterium]
MNLLADLHPPLFYVMMIPIAGLVFTAFFMAVSLYFRNQEEKRMHETARLALEKGQPIPSFSPAWVAPRPPAARQNSWIGLLIGGLVNIAVGTGLYLMLASMPGAYVARYCAFIPGLVGVALLVAALIVGVFSRTHSDRGGPPPMS